MTISITIALYLIAALFAAFFIYAVWRNRRWRRSPRHRIDALDERLSEAEREHFILIERVEKLRKKVQKIAKKQS